MFFKTETGELVITELKHQDKEQVRAFYQQFRGHVIVGLEASGYSPWFEAMLEELGCEVWLGDATEIRRRARWRHKDDRRDAELMWDLMVHQEFPRLHQPAPQSREILRMLRYWPREAGAVTRHRCCPCFPPVETPPNSGNQAQLVVFN